MTDDICGAECADGTPCEHPAGSCPVPSHSDPDAENPHGRPSAYTDDRAAAAVKAARQGKSKSGAARAASVDRATLDRWLDAHPDFRAEFTRARAQGETRLFEAAIGADDELDAQGARFLLSTSFDYHERTEVEHSGEVDVEVEADFSDTST